jgi:hypothetical protein
MALYDQHGPASTGPRHLQPIDQPSSRYLGSVLLPIMLAAAITVGLIAMLLAGSTATRPGDTTKAGPSVKTVNPSSSPSTAPTEPTPKPITEPRPTQAPIQ